jgi:hypothetical protein
MLSRCPSRAFVLVLIAIATILAYPLWFGPVYWICSDSQGRIDTEHRLIDPLFDLYTPVIWLELEGPAPIRQSIDWYLGLWGAP